MSHLIDIDTWLLLFINGMHCDFLDSLMWLISGKLVWAPFFVLTLLTVLRNRGWRPTFEMMLMIGIMMLFTDFLNAEIIRPWIHRMRPTNLDNPISSLVHVVNNYRGGRYGFPSAHAANYMGLSIIVAYFLRSRWIFMQFFLLTLLISISRNYLGVHYPGDVLAGMVYGACVASMLVCIHKRKLGNDETMWNCWKWVPGTAAGVSILVFIIISFL